MSEIAIPSSDHLPSEESSHELAPQVKAARARAGVLLLILSDVLMVASILAAGGYLNALNTNGMFKAATDQPAFPPGLVVAVVLLLSGLCYFWWARQARGKEQGGPRVLFVLALVLVVAALVLQIWAWTTLGYTTDPNAFPAYDAFQSVVLLLTAFTAVHLLLTSVVGLLLLGRMLRGRLAGQEYIVQAVGYWWYYTVLSGLLILLFIVVL